MGKTISKSVCGKSITKSLLIIPILFLLVIILSQLTYALPFNLSLKNPLAPEITTSTNAFRVDNGSSLKAFVDVIINSEVLVKGVKVFKDRDGNDSVGMPKQQGKNGRWYETVMLLTDEAKQELQQTVLDAFYV